MSDEHAGAEQQAFNEALASLNRADVNGFIDRVARARFYLHVAIREGRILRWHEYSQRSATLEAAGLSE